MGHYDNGEHGSNAPGDVEMARAACRIAGDDRRWPLQDPVCMAAENKKQVDYVRVRHANRINKTASDCAGA
ncbi:hypothetical protein DMI62_14365 [Escherichia coli]|nr:hypothetical protein [Escherichia coli]